MKIEYGGKVYPIITCQNKMMIEVGKQKLFAGFGEGNMNQGFKLVEEVPERAPKANT